MDYKKEMLKLLDDLKKKNHSRRKIEAALGYAPKSLDQILVKGGNEMALIKLRDYKREVDKGNILSPAVKNSYNKIVQETANKIIIDFILQEIAKLKSNKSGHSVEHELNELEQNVQLLLRKRPDED